jgi:hypothetical protein
MGAVGGGGSEDEMKPSRLFQRIPILNFFSSQNGFVKKVEWIDNKLLPDNNEDLLIGDNRCVNS